MTFNTSKCQEIFRLRFTGASGEPFVDFGNGKAINNQLVDESDIDAYKGVLHEDLRAFYYKALLSYIEGLAAVSRRNLTWATIKLYYSFYFGIRCSLLCRNVIMVRAARHLYYVRLMSREAMYEKSSDMTDHGGAISVYTKYFQQSDIICLQKIEDMDAYKWIKTCREVVNYKDIEFHDPNITDIWLNIIEDIEESSLARVLAKYMDDKEQYCSRATTAILAIPTIRMRSVVDDIKNERITVLSKEQKDWIKSIAKDFIGISEIEDLLI